MTHELDLEDFPTLKLNHVHIKDKKNLQRVISTILKEGCSSLQVVTDFDLTLTKQHVNGRKVLSSFGIFSKCKQLPQNYTKESNRLYEIYRPIEIDPHLSLETKIEAMNKWMIAAEEIIKGIPFNPDEIPEVAKIYGTDLRDGTKELFKKLHSAGVPVLVFSAGLGDVVEAILRNQGVLYDNVKVISNFLKYEDGKIAGFKNERLIHVFNKNEYAIEQEYLKVLEGRQNILLMGDTTGDASMVDGIVDTCAVLKIGFLYDHVENSLSSYMKQFDIVLIDDQTMQVPNDILKSLL
ncbi:7-methylguanosine phosphate-specific 5'-nucleotidase [Hylaeus anthracinus]|uniref:7-methylguanosine phosphate-specific 5'-nucleotidase n=1 Tax=Hylaeus anthracinus TaxID=313031 RepID=UPI0023B9BB38|nr:7-methylguanosine phosphate-specific 5'-nucleotidase [Hylaeus anthracinus]XP_054011393.1 7-methylguanosine phosphate-specific 5'-nucleotidase [Hylaeus anthracinus]